MPALKPAYLIHGDDHGRIAERRANLRALAESQVGAGGYEVLEGDAGSAEAVGLALSAMTLSVGHRIVIVEGAERYTDAQVESHLVPVLQTPPPETTVAFFAREEGRAKAPKALHGLVKKAGGEVAEEGTVKPWELPAWVRSQAERLGLTMDAGAARALVAQVGERQQRLLREIERLVLELDPGATLHEEDVQGAAAHSCERKVWALADAAAAGDGTAALRTFLALRDQGERLGGMSYWMAQRLRLALEVAGRLAAGEPASAISRGLRMPPKAAERFIADARRSDPDRLAQALAALADLELDTRGGARVLGDRRVRGALDEPTQMVMMLAELAVSA
ncbi:MAG TPA: DNA polymerase III subunit delta [Solirubrobacteraceae bacterium]|jgi:DNA polymerase-3 subunit delta|nr:DNA polymerase III subunit delta [Solirubrobacteraceae bacterium]